MRFASPPGQAWASHARMTKQLMSTPSLRGFGLYPNAASPAAADLTVDDSAQFPYVSTVVGTGLVLGILAYLFWPRKA